MTDTPHATLDEALGMVPEGWYWTLEYFGNHPWAKRYYFLLHSAHEEPDVHSYAHTATAAVLSCLEKIR